MPTRILLTGCGGSAATNFKDALDLTGNYRFVGVDTNKFMLELSDIESKYRLPSGFRDYCSNLNQIIEKEDIDFIHCQPDPEVIFIAEYRDEINAKTFLPELITLDRCQDKWLFNVTLAERGVPVPKTLLVDTEMEILTMLNTYGKTWLRASRGAGSRASLPITDLSQAEGWINYWSDRGLGYGDFIASEFLPGKEFAWQSVWFEGQLVCGQARERVEYLNGSLMASGQSSSPSVARTVNRDDINDIAMRAIDAVEDKPHGVFCVDMKEDENGYPKVTEINAGRFFTTSNFFAHAGLNMPEIYMQLGLYGTTLYSGPQLNILPEDLYWIRNMECGSKLVEGPL